ncbi:WD40 repeat-like protein [Stereum hirsutum FP-91666 SS1]|uniref:WD40 repeat-like protein n=1 Tax=Stereum hirsutum (strain FP-91666) TaxID=721885 RepID=UPI00044498D3|nr:WD40 repeat-like protein [Stereum hirsutum FP-91666 SS1]EIM83885.1 WD40 repeat-like protein [Stereum hirsutum FP-91666 SS1]
MQTPPERHVLDFETLHNVLAVDRAVEHSIVDVSQATAAPSNQALAIRLSSQDPFRRPALSDHTAVRASISGHSHSQQRDFDFTPFSSSTRDTGHQCRHREIPSLTSPVDCYAASPDKWSPAGDWHLQKTIRTERKHIPYCNSLALSHDGRFVASGHEDGVIILWSTQTDDIVSGPLKGHTRRVNDIAFSPKDERIVTGSSDCTARIWDCTNQKLVKFDGHPRSVELVAFSPNGKQVVSSLHASEGPEGSLAIVLWDARSGEQILVLNTTHDFKDIRNVGFSTDGRFVMGTYLWVGDGSMELFTRQDGEVRAWNETNHLTWNRPVTLSATGEYIATISEDGIIMLYSRDSFSLSTLCITATEDIDEKHRKL